MRGDGEENTLSKLVAGELGRDRVGAGRGAAVVPERPREEERVRSARRVSRVVPRE